VNLFIACVLYSLGHTLNWFAMHSQFVWQWWEGKLFPAAITFGLPGVFCFVWGTTFAFKAMEELWGPRFLGFSMSFFVFPLLTWYFMNESMFTVKTMLCILLSFSILAVQIFWK